MSRFAAASRTQRELGGRAAVDPRLLVAIWIWSCSEVISSAREIERPMDYRPELRSLCGMEVVIQYTLSDFRVSHAVLTVLSKYASARQPARLVQTGL